MSISQVRRVILMLLFILIVVITPTFTQDAETTEDPTLPDMTATAVPTATPLPPTAGEPTLTFTPTPTPTIPAVLLTIPSLQAISPTIPVSVSSTYTATPTLIPVIETTEEPSPISATATELSPNTPTPTLQSPISATETVVVISPTPISATDTPLVIPQTPTSSTIVSISSTLFSVSPTLTPTVMLSISPTQIMTTITPTIQPTATIGGLALRYIQGIARYQNHVTDDSGILLQVYTDDLILVSEITTNEEGVYNPAVPIESAFWMVFSADGYLTERFYITETEGLADVTLLAGDLNGDQCINFDDLNLIQSQFNTSGNLFDLNNDAQTDLSDIAMLAGNLDPSCVVEVEATSTPGATITQTMQPTATSIFTLTPITAISPTATESATIEAETTEEP